MKNKEVCPLHIEYLDERDQKGKVFESRLIEDSLGGLVVYIAVKFEEAHSLAENDSHDDDNVQT
ncbi:hypothetical protein [Peribacillus sp. R9-11]|uniref:hypothetical protein n=1 Tax=Peribacillus sp. R9-11 TaxID=3073271 RepID=UPI0028684D08|nr:hypothetical protein [Peribacillus sp. R9-11]WMX55232.1 hypothetical protein RE409_24950 [Peribacillus sp. R9-11]